jgi:hypothetical protein
MIAVSAREQAVLDEFDLLRHLVPERLRVVVDELAHEHVALLRLVGGGTREVLDEREAHSESDREAV